MGWDEYEACNEYLAVARWGRNWFVVDRETGCQIGGPFPARRSARVYADHRYVTTYGGAR